MTLKNVLQKLSLPNEEFYLQKRRTDKDNRDELTGEFTKTFTDIKQITGIIRGESVFRSTRGEEEIPALKGYFLPTFDIPDQKLANYRIRRIIEIKGRRGKTEEQELFYEILEIDRDLRLHGKRHHIRLLLGKNVRWEGE